MPTREPHRTEYIDRLYKEKNIEWLQKEIEAVNRIISSYASDLLSVFNLLEKEKFEKAISNERDIRDKIEKYLFSLM